MRFDANLIGRVQQANDIVDVVGEHLRLDRKGKEFVGLCPFHADHRPSLYVSPDKQLFKCFACGAGGDVFKFVQLRESVTFPEAVQRLAERAGIEMHLEPGRRPSVPSVDPQRVARVNTWALEHWRANLNDPQKGAQARAYLERRRIDAAAIEQWQLGLALEAWDDLLGAARQKRIPDALLVQAGLVVEGAGGRPHDKFRNRLMFPIRDVTGRVIAFGGRALGEDPAKYLNSPATVLFDKSRCLYGLNAARHAIVSEGTAVVVEGYTDVIMAHQLGCTHVVATLGTSLTQDHARILRRYAKRIVLVFDSDTAGLEAANRALEVCLAQRIDVALAFMDAGQDPYDFLLTAGAEAFRGRLAAAVDVLEFKWRWLMEAAERAGTLQDRKALVEEYLRAAALMERFQGRDAIADGLIRARLRQITGLSDAELRREMRRLVRPGADQTRRDENRRVVRFDLGQGYYAVAQADVLEVLLNSPGLGAGRDSMIRAERFDVPVLRRIAEPLLAMVDRGDEVTAQALLRRIEDVEAGALVVELQERGRRKGRYAERLAAAARAFERHLAEQEKERMRTGLGAEKDEAHLRQIQELLRRSDPRRPGMIRG